MGRCGQAMREPSRRIIMLVTAGETAEADTVCGNAAAECYRPDAPNFNNRSALCVTIAEQIGGHTLDWWLDGSADRMCGGVVGQQRHASAMRTRVLLVQPRSGSIPDRTFESIVQSITQWRLTC